MKSYVSKPVSEEHRLQPIEFNLDGDHYTFTPGKRSGAAAEMLHVRNEAKFADMERTRRLLDWLADGLNREHNERPLLKRPGHAEAVKGCQACHLQARLLDPDDVLEVETVLEVVNDLISEVSGRPTGSPSA